MSGDFLRDKENNNAIKEKLVQVFCRILQRENVYAEEYYGQEIFKKYPKSMTVDIMEVLSPQRKRLTQLYQDKEGKPLFKYHVASCNGVKPIKNLFKARTWWSEYKEEEMDKVNFMWTAIRKPNIID